MTMDPAFHHNVIPINIDNLSMFLKTVILTFMVSHFLGSLYVAFWNFKSLFQTAAPIQSHFMYLEMDTERLSQSLEA